MKTIKFALLLLIVIGYWSCQKDESEPTFKGTTLITYKEVKSYTIQEIETLFTFASSQNPAFSDYVDHIVSGVTVYSITYSTPYINSKTITVSGLVIVPNSMSSDVMLMSFQNGTIVEHSKAPTENINNPEFMLLHASAGLGMAICMPDYIGFGSAKSLHHPYLNKALFQSTIINMIKAVKEMDDNNLLPVHLNGDLYLTGYSLGGWASLVTHRKIEESPIDGFQLIGSSCGAGSYNMLEMKDYLFNNTNYVQPFYVPFLLIGLQSTGDIQPELSLYFNTPYDERIPPLFDGLHSTGQINEQLNPNMQLLLTEGLRLNFDNNPLYSDLKTALIENSQPAWINEKPIHFYHGTEDVHVPYSISVNIYDDFTTLGQQSDKIIFTPLEGKNHSTGVMPMYTAVLEEITP